MALYHREFERLEKARTTYTRQTGGSKPLLQLAFEQIENLSEQQAKALMLVEAMVKWRNKSWCFRVPRFFKLLYARVRLWR